MSDYFDRSEFSLVRLKDLQSGVRLRAPIYDGSSERNLLLLAAGSVLTSNVIDLLKKRGVTSVRLHASEVSRMVAGQQVVPVPTQVRAGNPPPATVGRWGASTESFMRQVERRDDPRTDPVTISAFRSKLDLSFNQLSSVFEGFVDRSIVNTELVHMVTGGHLELMRRDFDAFVALSVQPAHREYPRQHSLQTGMVAVAIGAAMGLRKDDLFELAYGCVIHDAGLLKVPDNIYMQAAALSRNEWLELAKHPIHISDALNHSMNVPHGARMVAYQMHERMNGSGYPRQRSGAQIHILARIASVADTFLAMVSPRPHRPGLHPYHAVEQLLYSTKQGLYDSNVVRALLKTVSLFPIGSLVELSDGTVARVLRSNEEDYTRPIVELVTHKDAETGGEVIRLDEALDLKITRPVEQDEPALV